MDGGERMYDVILNLKNIVGKRTNRKIIVIECDDWGGIRMPSKEVFDRMLQIKMPVDKNVYDRLDSLADRQDLECLFEVLLSVKDKNDHAAVMTPVTNVANPDFKRIEESDFTQYYYEPFTETLNRYGRDPQTFNAWKKGIDMGIFIPEFHGREHISVQFWLKKLREGDETVRNAFKNEYVSIQVNGLHPALNGFRPEFYFNSQDQVVFLKNSILKGVELFRDIFGYVPRVFVPSNNIFHPTFEQTVAETGVKYLYVSHFSPVPDSKGNLKMKYYRIGKKTSLGLRYYTRNCAFEPVTHSYRGIDFTLNQIEAAFRWRKPANISTHRVNFIGAIEKSNRDHGLKELKNLLGAIVRKWPDVEFMSSADMLNLLHEA